MSDVLLRIEDLGETLRRVLTDGATDG